MVCNIPDFATTSADNLVKIIIPPDMTMRINTVYDGLEELSKHTILIFLAFRWLHLPKFHLDY